MSPPSPVQKVRRQAYLMIAGQFGLTILVAIIVGCVASLDTALAILWGGLSALLPQWFFAWKFFRHGGATALKAILSSFYWGEIFKLLLTAVLVIAIWKTVQPQPLAFLAGFILAQCGIFLAPLMIKK